MKALILPLLICFSFEALSQEQQNSEARSVALMLRDRDEAAGRSLQLKEQLQEIEVALRTINFSLDSLRGAVPTDESAVSQLLKKRAELIGTIKSGAVSMPLLEATCDVVDKVRQPLDQLVLTENDLRKKLVLSQRLLSFSPELQALGVTPEARGVTRFPTSRLRMRALAIPELEDVESACFDRVNGERPDAKQRIEIASGLADLLNKFEEKWLTSRRQVVVERLQQPWIKAQSSLQALNASTRKEAEEIETRLKQLNREVANADTRLQAQEAVDSRLVYATYGMIFALFVLGLFLIRSDSGKAAALTVLIENRTIVELVSIGFMLVTIIILGAGKRLSGETLGALLGTIAGYVFGREVGRRRVDQTVEAKSTEGTGTRLDS
jgi:hypothetical protein